MTASTGLASTGEHDRRWRALNSSRPTQMPVKRRSNRFRRCDGPSTRLRIRPVSAGSADTPAVAGRRAGLTHAEGVRYPARPDRAPRPPRRQGGTDADRVAGQLRRGGQPVANDLRPAQGARRRLERPAVHRHDPEARLSLRGRRARRSKHARRDAVSGAAGDVGEADRAAVPHPANRCRDRLPGVQHFRMRSPAH